jgi:hypothetical protein
MTWLLSAVFFIGVATGLAAGILIGAWIQANDKGV